MSCGIYKITNKINNHCYIGQSINIKKRWWSHKNYREFQKDYPLYRAFKKYGIENFVFEVIEECRVSELDEKEKYWINYYDSYINGYNQTIGGQSKNFISKISGDNVKKIYELLQNSDLTEKEISKIFNVSENMISYINVGKSRVQDGYEFPLRKQKRREIVYCKNCGKEIKKNANSLCKKCYDLERRIVIRPDRNTLKKMVRKNSFLQLGKIFNVSDKMISKWCASENIPYKKKEINLYTDEEWDKI